VDAVDAVPVVGTPMAYGLGFLVLILIAFAESWAGSVVSIAHEGAHMAMAVLTFRGHHGFELLENGNARTSIADPSFGVGDWFVTFAGYALPPLLGVGGANLLRNGNAWGTLWIAIVLMFVAFLQARNALANLVTLLALFGTGYVALTGSPVLQAGLAVALVWWMLIGGLVSAIHLSRGDNSDAYWLARRTLIPRVVWHCIWVVIAIVCLWKGGRALLVI
jgi:hypothetical protein